MADTNELKPCPCGQTPSALTIAAEHEKPKYAHCAGICCGEWEIEFRNNHLHIEGPESYALAVAGWNAAIRPHVSVASTPPADAALAENAAIDCLRACAQAMRIFDRPDTAAEVDRATDAIAAALRARAVPDKMTAVALLDAFDADTEKVPVGEESETRGKSVYNWRRAIVREMRAMLAASKEDGK